MLRSCIICKDEYYGDSWGVTLPDKTVKCFYCYEGNDERKYKPEWETIDQNKGE